MTDAQCLDEFARTRAAAALGEVVRQYVDLVYATARRLVNDPHLADDITQATFVVMVKKANRLDPRTLPGWLVNTARLAAKEAIRAKLTRDKHESRAARLAGERMAGVGDNSILFMPINVDRGRVEMIVTDTFTAEDVRVVAVDNAGKEIPMSASMTTGTSAVRQLVVNAGSLTANDVKSIRFQTRPFDQWIEFRNISLHPGQKTDVQVSTGENVQSGKVYVGGDVQRPGVYDILTRKQTLTQVVISAGTADLSAKVTLIRRADEKKQYIVVQDVPLSEIVNGQRDDEYLVADDVVTVAAVKK